MRRLRDRLNGALHGQTKPAGVDHFEPKEFYACESCGRLYNARVNLGLVGSQPSEHAQFTCKCGVTTHIEFERVTRW